MVLLNSSSFGDFWNISGEDISSMFPTDNATSTAQSIPGGLLTKDDYIMTLKCTIGPRFLLAVIGVITNVINIRTFLRMGLEDCVTIVFFNLAIADLLILLDSTASAVGHLLEILELDHDVEYRLHPFIVGAFCTMLDRFFKDIAMYSIAFLGVQRSLCVLMPLHFKGMFTRARTCAVLSLIWFYGMLSCGTNVSSYYIAEIPIPGTNTTTYLLLNRAHVQIANTLLNTVNAIFINFLCQVTVLCCVIIMTYELSKSRKFRQTASSGVVASSSSSSKSPASQETSKRALESQSAKTGDAKTAPPSEGRMSSKERQAITQVAIVCMVFLITSAPMMITSIAEELNTELAVFRRYHFTFVICFAIRLVVEMCNSVVNFFIYYRYNTKFRQLCFS